MKIYQIFKVTSEQEDYVKGFTDALTLLQNTETSQKQQTIGSVTAAIVASSTISAAGVSVVPVSSNATINNISTTTNSVVNSVGLSGGTFTYNLGKLSGI